MSKRRKTLAVIVGLTSAVAGGSVTTAAATASAGTVSAATASAGTVSAATASAAGRTWTVALLPIARAAISKVSSVGDTTLAVGFGFGGSGRDTYFVPMTVRFTDGAWRSEPAPLPAGITVGRLDDVAVVHPGDAWAVGSTEDAAGPHPLIEHWNGATWSVSSTSALPAAAGLEGIAADAPDDAWAIGYTIGSTGISPLVAHWDGKAWTPMTIPADEGASWNRTWLSGVSASGPGDVWVVGAGRTAVHYDGHHWTATPIGTGEVWLERVRSSPGSGTWAVGYTVAADHSRTPAALKWDGRAWQAAALPRDVNAQLEDIAAGPGGMTAVGYRMTGTGPHSYALSVSEPGGATAQPVAIPKGATQLNGAAFGDGRLWAVGDGADLYDGTIAPFTAWQH